MTAPAPGRMRQLSAGDYYQEDLGAGDWYRTDGIVVTAAHIDAFAELSGDDFDLHMDEEAARKLGFPGRVAHGILGLALVDGLKGKSPVRLVAIVSLGWDWDFTAPILIGDRLVAVITVASSRAASDGERGLVTFHIEAEKQDGTIVQRGANTLLMKRRAAAI